MNPFELKSNHEKSQDELMDEDADGPIEEKKEKEETPLLCLNCAFVISDPSFKACVKCGYYRPAEGEMLDLSKVFWKLPTDMINKIPIRSVETPHDLPFPGGFGSGDEVNGPGCAEWTVNHLPIMEEQKEDLIIKLEQEMKTEKKEKCKDDREKQRKDTIEQQIKEKWARRQQGKEGSREAWRKKVLSTYTPS